MSVNHHHLRAFHAIAIEGSFSAAARRLNVAQPTLSQKIKALEGRHRAALFERGHLPIKLTPLGHELFALTQRMFATSAEIDDLLGDIVDASTPSTVRLGADSPIYAARLVQAFIQTRPDARMEVRVDNARETLRRLQEAVVNVAIVSDPPMHGDLYYEPLFTDVLSVAVPAGHALAKAPVFPLDALATERLLLREPASKTRAATEVLLEHAGAKPERILELHSREAIREAIALGMGVSLFFSTECPPDERLAFLRPDRQAERAQLTGYIVCRAEQRRTAMMRSVFKAAETLKMLSPRPLQRRLLAEPIPSVLMVSA